VDADREAEAEEAIGLRDALIAGLAGAASQLDDTAREMYRAATWLPWQKRLMLVLIAMQTVAVLALLGGMVVLIDFGSTNKSNTTATLRSADQIESCTTPGGACYQRNAENTANAVELLIRSIPVITAECAHEGSDVAIETCVEAKIKLLGFDK
jgi:hypothetical protein